VALVLGTMQTVPGLKQLQLVYPASTPGCNVSLLDAMGQSTWYIVGFYRVLFCLRPLCGLIAEKATALKTTLIKHRHDTPMVLHIYDSSSEYRAGLHMPIEKISLGHKSVKGLEPSLSWISRLFCGTNVVIPWRISYLLHAPTHVTNQGIAIQLGKFVS